MTGDRPLVVFGASGFVGRHLIAHAVASWRGPVTAVSRTLVEGFRPDDSGMTPARVTVLQAGAGDRARLLDHIAPDSVVVNLAYGASAGHDENMALVDGIADVCAAARVARLVHVSTAMVVGRCRERWISEETECQPVTAYERTKLDVEARLRQRAADMFPLVILRPTAVFGRGGANLRKLTRDLTTRSWAENYLRSALFGNRAMHLVPVETVVAAIVFAAASDRAGATADDLYLVADDEAPGNTFCEVERVLRQALDVPAPPIPAIRLPPGVLPLILRAAGRSSLDPRARFSTARLRQAGFSPPVAFADALTRYAEDARAALQPEPPR